MSDQLEHYVEVIHSLRAELEETSEFGNGLAMAVNALRDERDTLLTALKSLIKSLSDSDEEGLIEHTQQMMDARAAVEAVEGKPLIGEHDE